MIRALTLWQPWASLIAIGAKSIETRSWQTRYRGPLLIHAAARPLRNVPGLGHVMHDGLGDTRFVLDKPWFDPEDGSMVHSFPTPLSAVVAVTDLVDCAPMVDDPPDPPDADDSRIDIDSDCGLYLLRPTDGDDGCDWSPGHTATLIEDQTPFGHFEGGRFGWVLDGVHFLERPVPCGGRQGSWSPTPDVLAAVHEQVPDLW